MKRIMSSFIALSLALISTLHVSLNTVNAESEIHTPFKKENGNTENIMKNSNTHNPITVKEGIKYINNFKDSDIWYSFTPKTTGSHIVNIIGNGDTYGVLFDDTKTNIIMEGRKSFNTKTIEMANTFVKGQIYYIKVNSKNFNSSNNKHTLFIEKLDNPNDESFKEQWGILNSINGIDINVLPAWKYSKGRMVKIGIADTGTDYNHLDLKNNIDMLLSYNFVHDIEDVFPIDENFTNSSAKAGHGTHVSGIIGAESNNRQGVTGIAPKSMIIPLKVMGSRRVENPTYNGSIVSFVKSIQYAKANEIKIMNCSFGGYAPSAIEKEAMLNASEILFVIAAGNNGNDLSVYPEYPASYYHENSLVVSAINSNGKLSQFSNYGGPTDIAAPGEEIISTYPENIYTYNSGTSMATPAISAVAGLIWSVDLGLTPIEVKTKITSDDNITKLNGLSNKVLSGGIVNAFKAITSNENSSDVNAISTKTIYKDVFEYDVKSRIKHYKENTSDEEKTNSIIVKFKDSIIIKDFVEEIKRESNFDKIREIDYLESVDAYVLELSSIEEADRLVDIFNSYEGVVYSEPNYIRKMS